MDPISFKCPLARDFLAFFLYNCFINEASKYSPFEVSYGFQRATHTDRLLSLTGTSALIVDRFTELASVIDVIDIPYSITPCATFVRTERKPTNPEYTIE